MADFFQYLLRGVAILIAASCFVLGQQGLAFANNRCTEAGSAGKFWEFRAVRVEGYKKGLKQGIGQNKINGKGVKEALNTYLLKAASWSTQQHVDNINDLKAKLGGFEGTQGFLGLMWVAIANKALSHYNTNTLNNNAKISIDAKGRINKNKVAPHPNEDAFYFNGNDGSGHIWATMCYEIRFAGTGDNDDPDARVQYMLKTEIAPCGFKVIDRGTGGTGQPIFVGSYMPFEGSPQNQQFVKKLEAVNFLKGDDTGGNCPADPPANGFVTLGKAFVDLGDGVWTEYTEVSNGYLFEPNPQACIDMFFASTTIPNSLVDGDDRPNYCLGRCSDPPVVNTGM